MNERCEQHFQELKARLTMAQILAMRTKLGKYVVYSDASRIGLGCVLMQDEKVIA